MGLASTMVAADGLLDAARRYTADVAAGRYPDQDHSYA